MKLSKNFDLQEFLQSETATRFGYSEQFTPPDKVIDNLKALCENLLQPIRDVLPEGKIRISSGYRCDRLNRQVHGKANSQHLQGYAADCQFFGWDGKMDNRKIIDAVKTHNFEFDQMIDEYGLSWVHLSYRPDHANRKQSFGIDE